MYWYNGQYDINLLHLHARNCCASVTTLCRYSGGRAMHSTDCPLVLQVFAFVDNVTLLPSVLRCCWFGGRKGIRPVKNGGWWRWTLLSPDGVMFRQMVSVSVCVNLPLHQKSRSSLLAPAHPGGPGKRAVKRLWWWWW